LFVGLVLGNIVLCVALMVLVAFLLRRKGHAELVEEVEMVETFGETRTGSSESSISSCQNSESESVLSSLEISENSDSKSVLTSHEFSKSDGSEKYELSDTSSEDEENHEYGAVSYTCSSTSSWESDVEKRMQKKRQNCGNYLSKLKTLKGTDGESATVKVDDDRMHIPFDDLKFGKEIGAGSFGKHIS